MNEYIERESLYEKAYWHGEHPDVGNPFPDGVDAIDIKDVDAIPSADVAPVRHGRWVKMDTTGLLAVEPVWNCSSCGYPVGVSVAGSKYCPNCGCMMDLED